MIGIGVPMHDEEPAEDCAVPAGERHKRIMSELKQKGTRDAQRNEGRDRGTITARSPGHGVHLDELPSE